MAISKSFMDLINKTPYHIKEGSTNFSAKEIKDNLRAFYQLKLPDNFQEIGLIRQNNSIEIDQLRSGRCLLLGHAGIGKTTLCNYLANQWATLEDYFVFKIHLGNLNAVDYQNTSLASIISNECFSKDSQPSSSQVQEILWSSTKKTSAKQKFLFILDGYDEFSKNSPCRETIEELLLKDRYPEIDVILSSRFIGDRSQFQFDQEVRCIGLRISPDSKSTSFLFKVFSLVKVDIDRSHEFFNRGFFLYDLDKEIQNKLIELELRINSGEVYSTSKLVFEKYESALFNFVNRLWEIYEQRVKVAYQFSQEEVEKKRVEIEKCLAQIARSTIDSRGRFSEKVLKNAIKDSYKCKLYCISSYMNEVLEVGIFDYDEKSNELAFCLPALVYYYNYKYLKQSTYASPKPIPPCLIPKNPATPVKVLKSLKEFSRVASVGNQENKADEETTSPEEIILIKESGNASAIKKSSISLKPPSLSLPIMKSTNTKWVDSEGESLVQSGLDQGFRKPTTIKPEYNQVFHHFHRISHHFHPVDENEQMKESAEPTFGLMS